MTHILRQISYSHNAIIRKQKVTKTQKSLKKLIPTFVILKKQEGVIKFFNIAGNGLKPNRFTYVHHNTSKTHLVIETQSLFSKEIDNNSCNSTKTRGHPQIL